MKRLNFLIVAAVVAVVACAGGRAASQAENFCQADTITVTGKYLSEPMKVTVVKPTSYFAENDTVHYPVVYLLNGYGGSYKNWGIISPLAKYANDYGCIIVCPSGMNSWYWDSPVVPGMQMESFIIKELIPHIDANYRTRTDRLGKAITGFSMGGHGALWLAIRHSDIFGSAGSTSGGVNIIPFPNNWKMKEWLGEYKDNPQRWEAHTVKNLIDSLKPDQLNIIFDCGVEDFFYKVNCDLDSALNVRKIPHTYITAPGAHTAQYWSNSIIAQLEYFNRIFKDSAK